MDGWLGVVIMIALGVGMAYLFTLVLLPILLDIWHPVKAHTPTRSGRLDRLAAGWRGLSVAVKLPLAIGYCGLLIVLGGPELGGFIATHVPLPVRHIEGPRTPDGLFQDGQPRDLPLQLLTFHGVI